MDTGDIGLLIVIIVFFTAVIIGIVVVSVRAYHQHQAHQQAAHQIEHQIEQMLQDEVPPDAPPAPFPVFGGPTTVLGQRKPKRPPVPPAAPTPVTLPDVPGIDGQRRLYVEWCARRLSEAERAVAAARAEAEDRLTEATGELYREARALGDAERCVAWLEELRDRRAAAAGEDFDALAALPCVARVEPADYGWRVVTTGIRVTDGAHPTDLGKFEVHLGLTGRLRIFNQTRRVVVDGTTWDHPWVRDGEPVFPPAVRVRVIRAVAARAYAGAVAAITEFLASGDASCGLVALHHWPRIEEETHERIRRIVP